MLSVKMQAKRLVEKSGIHRTGMLFHFTFEMTYGGEQATQPAKMPLV
jgi:hypothetical protein